MKNLNKVQTYLSNLAVLNFKLHNLHWNVEGSQFMHIHEFTEGLYEDFFERFDEIAEILKMKQEMPLVTMNEYSDKATIKEEEGRAFEPDEVLEIVEEDLKEMKKLATEIRNTADEEGNVELVAEFEDHIADYSQKLWFIRATRSN